MRLGIRRLLGRWRWLLLCLRRGLRHCIAVILSKEIVPKGECEQYGKREKVHFDFHDFLPEVTRRMPATCMPEGEPADCPSRAASVFRFRMREIGDRKHTQTDAARRFPVEEYRESRSRVASTFPVSYLHNLRASEQIGAGIPRKEGNRTFEEGGVSLRGRIRTTMRWQEGACSVLGFEPTLFGRGEQPR